MTFKKAILPFIIFTVLVGFLVVGLTLNPRLVPSPFVGKPAPQFSLPELLDNGSTVSNQDMQNKVWLFNVWASWCAECLDEHAYLVNLAQRENIEIVGLNYKDERKNAIAWLDRHGNPYSRIGFDLAGNVGIDYGVYGVPETFVIDPSGVVRFKHIGALTPEIIDRKILPMINQLNADAGSSGQS